MADWSQFTRAQTTQEYAAILRDWHTPQDENDRDWVDFIQLVSAHAFVFKQKYLFFSARAYQNPP